MSGMQMPGGVELVNSWTRISAGPVTIAVLIIFLGIIAILWWVSSKAPVAIRLGFIVLICWWCWHESSRLLKLAPEQVIQVTIDGTDTFMEMYQLYYFEDLKDGVFTMVPRR